MSVHGVIIQPRLLDLYEAVAVMFACYYVYNLEYNKALVGTLEYIQR